MQLTSIPAAPVNLVRAITALATRIDVALQRLDEIAASVVVLNGEVRGMREGLEDIAQRVDGLRGDVQSMGAGVGSIRTATESLQETVGEVAGGIVDVDERLVQLAGTLVSVDALATRLSRLGGRRSRATRGDHTGEADPEALVEEP